MLEVPRAGKRILTKTLTNRFLRPKINDPIGEDRVIGVDTESLPNSAGVLQTVLTPYSSKWGEWCQDTITPINNPIEILLDFTMDKYGENYERRSRVKNRMGKGSRESITPVLWVFYNLEYDLQRLFESDDEFFTFIRTGQENMITRVGKYEIQWAQCNPTGSSPSFQILVFNTIKQQVCRIYARDMWGYWKTGLGKTAESLGLGKKMDDVPPEWFEIPIEQWTDEMVNTLIRYAKHDPKLTREIYLATAKLLGSLNTAVFNRAGLLPPSAPAAAARMAFSMASEEEWYRAYPQFEQLALDAYHGGYVAMLERGKVEHVTVGDLHSAYPSAMLLLPDPCTVEYVNIPMGVWKKEIPKGIRMHRCMGFVRATFTIKEGSRFPSVSEQTPKYTAHQPGRYEKFAISLPELSTLFDLGQIEQAHIHEGFILVGSPKDSFLRNFVLKFYEIKEKEEREGRKNSPLYLVAKLLMNALYGKLIEIHSPPLPAVAKSHDLSMVFALPPLATKRREAILEMAQAYISANGSYAPLMKMDYANRKHSMALGLQPECITLAEILQNPDTTAGAYFMPIYASLITAMTRAKICVMMNCFDAIGGDTDSFFTSMRPGTVTWGLAEERAHEYSVRAGCGGVKDQPGLLGYGIEMTDATGYVAGIKQYTLTGINEKGESENKLAHHAITDPPGKNPKERKAFCSSAVQQLALGQAVTYTTRRKPRRLRESLLKNDGRYGYFISKQRTVTPKQDERLRVTDHISGNIHYEWKPRNEVVIQSV